MKLPKATVELARRFAFLWNTGDHEDVVYVFADGELLRSKSKIEGAIATFALKERGHGEAKISTETAAGILNSI